MAAATTTAASAPDQLELYSVRDDLAHTHNPANAFERMLITEMAQCWLRLAKRSRHRTPLLRRP